LNNVDGVIAAGLHLAVQGGNVDNTRGTLQAQGGNATLRVGDLNNTAGSVYAAGKLDTAAASVTNTGSLYAGGDQLLAASGAVTNGGTIAAEGSTTVNAFSLSSGVGSLLGAGVKVDSTLGQSGDLSITTVHTLAAHGENLAGGQASLQGTSIDLSGSQSGGASVALRATAGDVTTSGATVATGGTLAITATTGGHGLVNTHGKLGGDRLDLQVANLDNRQGTLVQSGSGDGSIVMSASDGVLDNTEGRIAVNANNLRIGAATLTNVDGHIEHAGTGTLNIGATTFDNERGSVASNGTASLVADDLNHVGATTSARDLSVHAGTLANRGGHLLQSGVGSLALEVARGLDNAGGEIAADGATTIRAGALNNTSGTLTAAGAGMLAIDVGGDVDNGQGGLIAAASALAINAGAILNQSGAINAGGTLAAHATGAIQNAQGVIVTSGDAQLSAAQLANNFGTITTLQGKLDINTSGVTNNDSGTIQAKGDLTLTNSGLSNTKANVAADGGTIVGRNVDIDSHGQALNNRLGTIASSQNLAMRSGALDNAGGLIQSIGTLALDTNGATLDNSGAAAYSLLHPNTGGGIVSAGAAQLRVGAWNNAGGLFGAGGTADAFATGALANNAGGQILGASGLGLTIASLDNQGGQIQALGDLSVRATTGNVNNSGSLIRTGATLDISANGIDNSNTLGAEQGLEGRNIVVTGPRLDNDHGAIRADENAQIGLVGTLTNTAGLISAGHTLTVGATATPGLSIDNSGGTLIGGSLTQVRTANIAGAGRLLSLGDLALDLSGDYVQAEGNQLAAVGSMSLRLGGDLHNAGKLSAGANLDIEARNVDNDASGEISSGGLTQVSAADTLHNRGLIDGSDTRLDAGTVDNAGTGRIYGDHVSIAAGTLNNDVENGVAATIAARSRLDIGAQTINNREHALIFSAGDLAIGGALDANRLASGRAASVTNASASIEALGNLSLDAGQVNNLNNHLSTKFVTTSEWVQEDRNFATVATRDGSLMNTWDRYEFTRTTQETVVTSSDPGRIVAGGNLAINAGGVVNDNSHILAGGTVQISAIPVNNETQGVRITSEYGRVRGMVLRENEMYEEHYTSDSVWAPPDVVKPTSLNDSRVEQYTATTEGSAPGMTATSGVAGSTSSAGQATAAVTTSAIDNVSATTGTVNAASGNAAATASAANAPGAANLGDGSARIVSIGAATGEHATVSGPSGQASPADAMDVGFSSGQVAHGAVGSASGPAAQHHAEAALSALVAVGHATSAHATVSDAAKEAISANAMDVGFSRRQLAQDAVGSAAGPAGQHEADAAAAALVAIGAATGEHASVSGPAAQASSANAMEVGFSMRQLAQAAVDLASGLAGQDQADGALAAPDSFAPATGERATGSGPAVQASAADAMHVGFSNRQVSAGEVGTISGLAGLASAAAVSKMPHGTIDPATGLPVAQASGSNGAGGATLAVPASVGVDHAGAAGVGRASAVDAAARAQAPGVTHAALAQTAGGTHTVRTSAPASQLPVGSLFQVHPSPSSGYLIETDPRFTGYQQWIGSDYMLAQAGYDPALTQKRLGDGFYEQKLVREQVAQLTGQRFLGDYTSDDEEYRSLLDAGIAYAKEMKLRPGVALTQEQMAALTEDIVWLVAQEVTLPDGSVQAVLAPQVYVVSQDRDVGLAVVFGRDVQMTSTGDMTNTGSIFARDSAQLVADNINNLGGRIQANSVLAGATTDVNNIGGAISAGHELIATAGRDINVETTTRSATSSVGGNAFERTTIDRTGSVAVTGEGGTLVVNAGRDVKLVAAAIDNAGTDGITLVNAGRNLNLDVVTTATSDFVVSASRSKESSSTVIGTTVHGSGAMTLQAGADVNLVAATIDNAGQDASTFINAGRNLNLGAASNATAATGTITDFGAWRPNGNRVESSSTAVGTVVQGVGAITLQGGNDINLVAATIANAGKDGKTVINAGNNLNLATATTTSRISDSWDALNYRNENTSREVGTAIQGAGPVELQAGTDVNLRAANVDAGGALTALAGRDLNVVAGVSTSRVDQMHQSTDSGFMNETTTTTHDTFDGTSAIGSVLGGATVNLAARHDLKAVGSAVVGDGNVSLVAANAISIEAATDHSHETHDSKVQESGLLSGGGFGISFGTRTTTTNQVQDGDTQSGLARSTVGSIGGNVTINAGDAIKIAGADLSAGRDINLVGKSVSITPGVDSATGSYVTKMTQDALTLALTGTVANVVNAIHTTEQMKNAAGQVKSGRLKALAAATAAMGAASTASDIAQNGVSIGISLTAGHSESEQSTTTASTTHVGSGITAGNDINISASAGGQGSNIDIVGSDLQAKKNIHLTADNQVNLLAAQDLESQHSQSQSMSATAGVGVSFGTNGMGVGYTASISVGRGTEDGEGTTQLNTHLDAGGQLAIGTGGDTNLKGAVASANQVVADVKGDMNIQSLQDTAKFDSKKQNISVSGTVGVGANVSVGYNQSRVSADFVSVQEQSGIKAGDGGFQVTVGGNTDLAGGLLSSSQAAVDQGKNVLNTGSLTSSNLQNKDRYDASGFALTATVAPKDKPAASGGIGAVSGSQDSTTVSGISGGLVTITDPAKQLNTGKDAETVLAGVDRNVTTESAAAKSGALVKAWDGQQLQKDIDAQVAITQAYSKEAPKAIANYAAAQAKAIRDQKGSEEEAAKWDEGGAYRVALHTMSGAATGGLGGALGAAAVADSAQLFNEWQVKGVAALFERGMSPEAAKAVAQGIAEATSLGIGAAVGGTAGAASALTTDTNNRALDMNEIRVIEKLAKDKAKQQCRGNADCEARANVIWTDALERTVKGLVDTKEEARNAAYIQALAKASSDPNSEGGRGEFAAYLDMLSTAQSLLAPYAGKPIVYRGKTVILDGSPETYFSATQAQRDNTYANRFAQDPESIVPGKSLRDDYRVEAFTAQNGSAIPTYEAEALLLGGAASNRLLGTLGRYVASLDVELTGTAGASVSGNISAKQITQEGMSLRLTPAERSVVGQLSGQTESSIAGPLREFVSDNYFMRNGFTRFEGKCGSNCFDGVYVKGDTVYINEVKPLNADGSIKLNGPDGTLPTQMTDEWVRNAAERLRVSNSPNASRTADLIESALNSGKLVKLVTGVNEKGVTMVKLKGGN
jgi:adhesin HecA-like repeat protein